MPIIVLSGQNERQAIAHAVEMGANDFICSRWTARFSPRS